MQTGEVFIIRPDGEIQVQTGRVFAIDVQRVDSSIQSFDRLHVHRSKCALAHVDSSIRRLSISRDSIRFVDFRFFDFSIRFDFSIFEDFALFDMHSNFNANEEI